MKIQEFTYAQRRTRDRIAVVVRSGRLRRGGGGYGGGGSATNGGGGTPGNVAYTAGVFQPSSGLISQCATPRSEQRSPNGPSVARSAGSRSPAENNFLRSWTNELYLWYREVPELDPNSASTTGAFFNQLKTFGSHGERSAARQVPFHVRNECVDCSVAVRCRGQLRCAILPCIGRPPRRIIVAYTEPNSPAAGVTLTRGAEIIQVDGQDAVNGNTQAIVDVLNAGVFPSAPNQTHSFVIRELSGTTRSITMTSANVTSSPVPTVSTLTTPSGPVGYLLFNDHIATAESALIDAITQLKGQNITDLVLDIRYNGGGYLDIASELAYMIGGQTTVGRTFERLQFNDKNPTTNPVTGAPLTPVPFFTTTQGFSVAQAVQTLPTLNLPRLYVLTGPGTCSASESIINSLRGVDIAVYQIGSTTCGKPYGFYPHRTTAARHTSRFSFRATMPRTSAPIGRLLAQQHLPAAGERIPGCSVADDFTRALGDANERRLATALAFRAGNNQATACPVASGVAPGGQLSKPNQALDQMEGFMIKSPARENRILREM